MNDRVPLSADDVARLIGESFAASESSRLSKHARLYDAVVTNINAGYLLPGQKLPGERELCVSTGISLGTVQKGLSQLVSDGRIQREHGRGTFVRATQPPLTDLWHYRFREPGSGRLLPVFARLIERSHVEGDASVIQLLGEDRLGYVRISRVINLDNRFQCWSEMHLPFSRFGDLMEVAQSDIEGVNLKLLLSSRFNSPTLATEQTVQVKAFPQSVTQYIGAKPRTSGLVLQIVGFSRDRAPITFQRIYVPPTEYEMEVSADAHSAPSDAGFRESAAAAHEPPNAFTTPVRDAAPSFNESQARTL